MSSLLGVFGQLGLALIDALERFPVLELEIELLERSQSLLIGVIDGENLTVELDSSLRILHHRLAQARGVRQELLAIVGIFDHLGLAPRGSNQGLHVIGDAVDVHQRIDGLQARGIDLQDPLVGAGRFLGLRQALHMGASQAYPGW